MDGESEGIIEVMNQQWASMLSMGGMFVGTILLGLSIQPLYDIPEARAFGEEGASKGGYVAMEMIFILIFTVAIIWLARKGLDYIIKAIVILALGMSLFYILLPYISLLYYLLGISSPDLVLASAILASISLMVLLVKYPEWYVVNTVGVLVGLSLIHI